MIFIDLELQNWSLTFYLIQVYKLFYV